jgi:hypothetical protein
MKEYSTEIIKRGTTYRGVRIRKRYEIIPGSNFRITSSECVCPCKPKYEGPFYFFGDTDPSYPYSTVKEVKAAIDSILGKITTDGREVTTEDLAIMNE